MPRENATEVPVGGVTVPKIGQSIGYLPVMDRSAGRSPHWDASEVPVGRVAVPKTGQKNASPRGDATEVLVGRVAVPKTGRRADS
ncbi:MAG: hypothetical protein ACI39T_04170 [Candidatus Cryptobacteroides sp.]